MNRVHCDDGLMGFFLSEDLSGSLRCLNAE
jgi:hypothetical protein